MSPEHERGSLINRVLSPISLIALTLEGSHVAAANIFLVCTRLTPLIGFQQMPLIISAASRIACINGGASRKQRDRLCPAAVVPQSPKQRVSVVQVAETGVDDLQPRQLSKYLTARHANISSDGAVIDNDGAASQRRGQPSPKRVPMATVEKVLALYRETYFDLN